MSSAAGTILRASASYCQSSALYQSRHVIKSLCLRPIKASMARRIGSGNVVHTSMILSNSELIGGVWVANAPDFAALRKPPYTLAIIYLHCPFRVSMGTRISVPCRLRTQETQSCKISSHILQYCLDYLGMFKCADDRIGDHPISPGWA